MENIDIGVLPSSQVDEQSDNECFDHNELMTSDVLPDDVVGQVEVHNHGGEPEALESLWAETQDEGKVPGKSLRRRTYLENL